VTASRHLILRLTLTGAILGLLFYLVPVANVGSTLRDLAPGYFALGVLAQFLMRAAATPRMRVVMSNQGVNIGYLQLFRILLISQFYTLLLPGPLAGGAATLLKYVQAGASTRAAMAAIMLNRTLGTLVMIVTGSVAWSLADRPAHVGTAYTLIAIVASILLAVILSTFFVVPRVSDSAGEPGWLRWLKGLANRLIQFQAVTPAGKLILLVSSLAHEFVGAFALWCFARSVGLSVDIPTLLWIRAALQMTLMLPLHIAGLGMREATLAGLGSLVGVPAATAVAWSLLIFCGSVVVSIVGGLLEVDSATRFFTRSKDPPLPDPGKGPES
jgi:uncharacterized membrane protein YbhN (UPF0104 family)